MISDNDLARISGAVRSAGFHLISAQLHDDDRELQVTVSAPLGPQLGKQAAPTRSACASFRPDRASPLAVERIPWSELTEREKFVVLADILAVLRQ